MNLITFRCVFINAQSASFCVCYFDTKLRVIIFHIWCLSLNMFFFVLFVTYCIKCFQFCVLNSFLLYELMFYFFVILDPLNLTVFLRHYFIQKSKLNWKWVLLFFMTINIEQWCIAVGTYGKSVIFIKRTRSYSFSCKSYLYLLLSLVCVIPLYLYCLISSNLGPPFILDKI